MIFFTFSNMASALISKAGEGDHAERPVEWNSKEAVRVPDQGLFHSHMPYLSQERLDFWTVS